MVSAGQPQGGIALHAVVADGRILQRAVQGVAHVQLTGDVRRGHHDGEGLLAFHAVGHKRASLFPSLIKFAFQCLGIKILFHFHGIHLYVLRCLNFTDGSCG